MFPRRIGLLAAYRGVEFGDYHVDIQPMHDGAFLYRFHGRAHAHKTSQPEPAEDFDGLRVGAQEVRDSSILGHTRLRFHSSLRLLERE